MTALQFWLFFRCLLDSVARTKDTRHPRLPIFEISLGWTNVITYLSCFITCLEHCVKVAGVIKSYRSLIKFEAPVEMQKFEKNHCGKDFSKPWLLVPIFDVFYDGNSPYDIFNFLMILQSQRFCFPFLMASLVSIPF